MATAAQLFSEGDLQRRYVTPQIKCPECGLRAEITDRFSFGSSNGRVEHVKTYCEAGHWLTPLIEDVEALPELTPVEPIGKGGHLAVHSV